MSSFTKIVIGALAAVGTVSALPQQYASSTTCTTSVVPAATGAPPAAVDNSALIRDLRGSSSANKRFQRLLTVDGQGKELLKDEELSKRVVFDFNTSQKGPGEGGVTKGAVSFTDNKSTTHGN